MLEAVERILQEERQLRCEKIGIICRNAEDILHEEREESRVLVRYDADVLQSRLRIDIEQGIVETNYFDGLRLKVFREIRPRFRASTERERDEYYGQ